MARNRVIYQSEGLYISKEATSTASGDHFHLPRVQSANYNFNIARQDINQYGELARIDSIVIEAPTVSLDFSYYVTDGKNEKNLGFDVTASGQPNPTQFAKGHITGGSGRNFYIVTSDEGSDLNLSSGSIGLSGKNAIGIGNAYLTDYTLDVAVGSIPTATVSFEAANMNAFKISGTNSGSNAAIDQENGTGLGTAIQLPAPSGHTGMVSALRPGDVTVSFGSFGGSGILSDLGGTNGLHLQSASISLPLSRSQIQRLGSQFAYARTVDFPVNATVSLNGVQNEFGSGSLVDLLKQNPKTTIEIKIKKPGNGNDSVVYKVLNAQLDSASVSSSIGANKTADLTFSAQIGGQEDTVNGIQMSGTFT
jgi:hypothetical protein